MMTSPARLGCAAIAAADRTANDPLYDGARPPIFIHSSWRVSHTWFWLKFRRQPSTLCFYEPFHEGLASLTRTEAQISAPQGWDSGHPRAEPYFLEFLPLIRRAGGVRLFRRECAD